MYNSVNVLPPQNSTQPLMFKLLATKVSTPLSDNVQIGPIYMWVASGTDIGWKTAGYTTVPVKGI